MPAIPIDTSQIVITASRAPESQAQTPASVTVIDQQAIERLGDPLVPSLLRLTPSAAVATSGPLGSLAEVRIRGAEANHSLVFVDGIKINDPASGDIPRFEILNADLASRIEAVRGPQSALWGSEAIGGVIAINGTADAPGYRANAEGGSFGFLRGSGSGTYRSDKASIAAALGWQRATGIDSFNGDGDKDGYRNLSGRIRGSWTVAPEIELGASALALTGRTQFDGFDPLTFAHTDTLDSSRNSLAGGRVWAQFGTDSSAWQGQVSSSLLDSSNKNYLDDVQQNRTRGTRWNLGAQVGRRFETGPLAHTLIAAADTERETFKARDTAFGGFTNQDRSRSHQALTLEWRGETEAVTGDLAVRRDMFNRFQDTTSVRASALVRLGGGFSIAGSYGKGISQPTFFDLYGFFPNNFAGNPSLKPESSGGFEGSARFRKGAVAASLTAYRQRLHDEIVTIFPPPIFIGTTTNLDTTSRRQGIEAEFGWTIGNQLRLSGNYSYLDATEPDMASGAQIRELRRPKHSGSVALDGSTRHITYGASIAYVGRHFDSRDVFPFDRVALGSYWLAEARVAYEVRQGVSLFVRGTNLLDQEYQDVFGYRTEGRGLYAGISLTGDRRSSP